MKKDLFISYITICTQRRATILAGSMLYYFNGTQSLPMYLQQLSEILYYITMYIPTMKKI